MYGTRSRSQAATLHKVAMLVRVEVLPNHTVLASPAVVKYLTPTLHYLVLPLAHLIPTLDYHPTQQHCLVPMCFEADWRCPKWMATQQLPTALELLTRLPPTGVRWSV
jgi:hypothetical protein